MDYIFDARRGRNPYPGRPFNGIASVAENWLHQGRVTDPAGIISQSPASPNTTSVVIDDAFWINTPDAIGGVGVAATPAAIPIGSFIRLIATGNRVRKITNVQANTPIAGQTTITWAGGTDSAANSLLGVGVITGTITALYVGGAMLDLAASWVAADQGSPVAGSSRFYATGFFDLGLSAIHQAIITVGIDGFPWFYVKSLRNPLDNLVTPAGPNLADRTIDVTRYVTVDPSGTTMVSSSARINLDNFIIENTTFIGHNDGQQTRLLNGVIKNGRLLTGTTANVFRCENLTFLNWDNTAGDTRIAGVVGNDTIFNYFRNIFIRRKAGTTTSILSTHSTTATTTKTDIQSVIVESANETDSIISFPGRTYQQSELKQEPANQLTIDTSFGSVRTFRRVEAYAPADPRSISNNVNLSTGVNRADSVYAGYAYLGSPVAHIGFERAGYSIPIHTNGLTVDVDDVNRIEQVVGTLSIVTDGLTGRLVIQGVPPYTFNWPSQEATRSAGPFTGTGPDGETIKQVKLADGQYYQEFSTAFNLQRIVALTSFRNGYNGVDNTLEAVDSLDTENPSKYTIKARVIKSDGTTVLHDSITPAADDPIPYNALLGLSANDAKYIRYQVSAVETVPRLA